MKTLIINGSPRKNGNTKDLIKSFQNELIGEVRVIDTYFESVSPCMDCRFCWTNDGCLINDGMQDIYTYINEADNVVLASPVYFSELSGSLLNFASRFQMYFASRRIRNDNSFILKEKKGIVLLVAGGDSRNLEERALSTANIIFRHLNTKLVGTVLSLQTDSVCGMIGTMAKDDLAALNKAKELATILNNQFLEA